MNVRNLFHQVSVQMRAKFDATKEVRHRLGAGTNREGIIEEHLREVLSDRYALGKGEVVTAENRRSGECDIVLYDGSRCPKLLVRPDYAIFPIESVFGVIQVKTTLTSTELASAYDNIKSVKEIIPHGTFEMEPSPMVRVGMARPQPVCAVVAFDGGRTLKTIAEQVEELDGKLPKLSLRPDLVVVLDQGIIGPRARLRKLTNELVLPAAKDLALVRMTKRHTWLRFCLKFIRELDTIQLPPLELERYLEMPEIVGGHRVRFHDYFVRVRDAEPEKRSVSKLNASAIARVLADTKGSTPVSQQDLLKLTVGAQMPSEMAAQFKGTGYVLYVFNPNKLPPLDASKFQIDETGHLKSTEPFFQPVEIEIDDNIYAVDLIAFAETDFDQRDDLDADELFAE